MRVEFVGQRPREVVPVSRKRKKPKFRVGQVVAWCSGGGKPLAYYRIASFFFDSEDRLRYTFNIEFGQLTNALCPVESLLRALNKGERGPR